MIKKFLKEAVNLLSTQWAKSKQRFINMGIFSKSNWQNFPTQSPICSRDDGFSDGLVGITFSKHRQESIKAYGNAIVPNVAYEIFKTIETIEKNKSCQEK